MNESMNYCEESIKELIEDLTGSEHVDVYNHFGIRITSFDASMLKNALEKLLELSQPKPPKES